MQSTQHSSGREGLIVLHKVNMTHMLVKLGLLKHFAEVSAFVTEPQRLDNPHSLDVLLDEIHVPILLVEIMGKVSHFNQRIQDNSRKTSTFAS